MESTGVSQWSFDVIENHRSDFLHSSDTSATWGYDERVHKLFTDLKKVVIQLGEINAQNSHLVWSTHANI
jgi:hypothetical protein